jgi:hypothetical protein
MTDRPLYRDLRIVFLDSWSDANGWSSMMRMIAGMSVPPFMTQQVALEIGRQWFGIDYE